MMASSRTNSLLAGSTLPFTASTLEDSFSAVSTSPVTCAIAAMNRLPKLWPDSWLSPSKRCWKSFSIRGSVSANATRQFLRSPGGIMPSSSRSLPDEPPSSATVTTAVTLEVACLMPRSSTDRPWPPPTTVMAGPLPSFRFS